MSGDGWLDQRPLLVAIAGPNGAGKTTFYHAHIAPAGLPLVNADNLARELDLEAYEAARLAGQVREALVEQQESFAFETVFSDPVGDKLGFLQRAATEGYTAALCFVGLASAKLSAERVAMRVTQGGHDVPADKLRNRYPRSLANLRSAIGTLPNVLVFDNSDLRQPFRKLAVYANGVQQELARPTPAWLRRVVSQVG